MPDLNDLLRWSIANSTQPQPPSTDNQLSLRFNPTANPSGGSSALHPSDPFYRTANPDDVSAASSPGPTTPVLGSNALPGMARRNDLNTDVLDVIMGKSDSASMKEKMAFAVDETKDLEDRVSAMDDMEMLVELMDNANNMSVLGLWEPLLSLLNSSHQPIVNHACWVIGTAVQNNLKAQAGLYVHRALPTLLSLIYPTGPSPSETTRARATYALSSALKHWPLASSALAANSSQGYTVLRRGVHDATPVIRRKMAFMVGTLVLQSGEKYEGEIPDEVRKLIQERMASGSEDGESLVEGLKREGVFAALLEELEGSNGDWEFEENALRALVNAAERGGLSEGEKARLKGMWEKLGSVGQHERGFGGQDGVNISKVLG